MTHFLRSIKPALTQNKINIRLWLLFILPLLPPITQAADFTTNFESTNFNSVQDFTVTNNGLSATFSGGTSFTIGNGALYHSGTKSWMLDPAGTTSRGTSTGVGTITFSSEATSLDFFIRTSNSNSTGQVQIVDSTGAIIEDITSTIVNGSWLHIEKTLNEGDALMASVTVRAFGNNMLAIDDLSFSTDTIPASDSNDNGGGGNGGSIGDPITGPEDDDDSEVEAEDETDTDNGIYEDNEESTTNTDDTGSGSSSGGGAFYWILFFIGGLLKRKLKSQHQ